MAWWQFALLGAGGGAIVEVLAVFRCVAAWHAAHRNRDGTIERVPPRLRSYVDVPAHAILLPARMMIGTAAAVLFGVTGQVTGPYGAVAIGCAAPVLLAQLGSVPQIAKAVSGPTGREKQINSEAENLGAIRKLSSDTAEPQGISTDATNILAARREALASELRTAAPTNEGGVAR
jgi:hypothetical protein